LSSKAIEEFVASRIVFESGDTMEIFALRAFGTDSVREMDTEISTIFAVFGLIFGLLHDGVSASEACVLVQHTPISCFVFS
jgi:hypothetical protein